MIQARLLLACIHVCMHGSGEVVWGSCIVACAWERESARELLSVAVIESESFEWIVEDEAISSLVWKLCVDKAKSTTALSSLLLRSISRPSP